MNIEQRVQFVRLLSNYLGENDITDRHVVLDRVDETLLLHAAEGMITELNLSTLAGVALDGIDCRLVFLNAERNSETDDLVNRGLAIYRNRVD